MSIFTQGIVDAATIDAAAILREEGGPTGHQYRDVVEVIRVIDEDSDVSTDAINVVRVLLDAVENDSGYGSAEYNKAFGELKGKVYSVLCALNTGGW
jgi:hypothetical protein